MTTREQMLYQNDQLVRLKEVQDEIERYKARLVKACVKAKQQGKKVSVDVRECKRELAKLNKELRYLSSHQQA